VKPGHRGERRIRRTHQAIERTLTGVSVTIGVLALLVLESHLSSVVWLLTRVELLEHLRRQQARSTAAASQAVIADIARAVESTPLDRAPVLVVTREGLTHLQWVAGEPPERPIAEPSQAPVSGAAREAVLLALAKGPRLGWHLRDELSTRFARERVGDALTALRADGKIVDVERRGRLVTWRLTEAGERDARVLADRKAAA
jgi:DNA-binding transcriptional ArsR family regulator